MNKIYKTTYCIASLLLVLLSACLKKNLGDYAPDKVNNLTINSSLKDAYLVNVNDVLNVNAKVEQSKGDGDLTYKWYYYPAASDTEAENIELSNTAELKVKIDMATGSYILVVESMDNKTGVKAFKKIKLTVKRLTSEGWLLLTWKDNKTNLSIVSSENEVFKDFLVPSSEFPIHTKPERIFCLNHWNRAIQPIVIQTAEPKLFFLDHNTFEIHNDENAAFNGGASPTITHFDADLIFSTYYMWDKDGLVYQSDGGGNVNYPSGFDQPMTGNYKASKISFPVVSGYPVSTVFYDEQSKGFQYQPYEQNKLLPFQSKPVNAPFSMSDFTDEIRFTALGAGNKTYIVGKNSKGEHHLYTLELDKALDIYPASSVVKLDIPNNVSPSFYAVSGKLPLLYYIIDNSLYLYKMGEKKSLPALYTFPEEETVAAFQMFRETIKMNEAVNPLVNNRLVVAVNKGAEGILYTFDLSATGALKTGRYATRNDGFDTIVDMAYKELR
ncbi:PKD-like family lipoprotein [Pedobacter gandavensis]|uniref:PKD-like family lipoprotein n=1 Tax=Pedobacter gandavensis TaxID=2679963 RepID=UPI00293185FF|nr:PKD-like family lipoprotein [Pedobacter gandavensis]